MRVWGFGIRPRCLAGRLSSAPRASRPNFGLNISGLAFRFRIYGFGLRVPVQVLGFEFGLLV